MAAGCVPMSLVPAFFVLMVFGEGLNTIGNTVPVVKTYLGGSVICILGAAAIEAAGLLPQQTYDTLNYFVNDSGFLVFYIAALITGSLFNIDRNLLLRATVKLLPVAVVSLAAGILLSGIFGILLGEGFWGGILYVGVPMTSGGMTAGTVPLSAIYSETLGVDASEVLTKMAPATVLGNCVAIVFGGLLNNFGKTHPETTGNGMLVNDGKPVKTPAPMKPTFALLCTGMVIAFAFYQLGAFLNHFVPIIPTYAWMIIAVVLVKGTGIMSAELEDAAREWGQFAIHSWTAAALTGIGFTLIDLNTILKTFNAPLPSGSRPDCGRHLPDGGVPWKACGLLSAGIGHCRRDVHDKHGRLRECGRLKQLSQDGASALRADRHKVMWGADADTWRNFGAGGGVRGYQVLRAPSSSLHTGMKARLNGYFAASSSLMSQPIPGWASMVRKPFWHVGPPETTRLIRASVVPSSWIPKLYSETFKCQLTAWVMGETSFGPCHAILTSKVSARAASFLASVTPPMRMISQRR